MTQYIKLTNIYCKHNNFKFKKGLNVDNIPINGGECTSGGLYFTTMKYIKEWLRYNNQYMYFIWDDLATQLG